MLNSYCHIVDLVHTQRSCRTALVVKLACSSMRLAVARCCTGSLLTLLMFWLMLGKRSSHEMDAVAGLCAKPPRFRAHYSSACCDTVRSLSTKPWSFLKRRSSCAHRG